jgi:hypothetical protein
MRPLRIRIKRTHQGATAVVSSSGTQGINSNKNGATHLHGEPYNITTCNNAQEIDRICDSIARGSFTGRMFGRNAYNWIQASELLLRTERALFAVPEKEWPGIATRHGRKTTGRLQPAQAA